jgi:uncharacterized protein YndB with AHSA1/START domain
MDSSLASLEIVEGLGILRYVRDFNVDITELWEAVTKPSEISRWMMTQEMKLEPRVGGQVLYDWGEEGVGSGTVNIFDPPHTVEYSWEEPAGVSVLRLDLREKQKGSELELVHRDLPFSTLSGVGPGWHTHLEFLGAILRDEDFDFWPRFHELEPVYEVLLSEHGVSLDS